MRLASVEGLEQTFDHFTRRRWYPGQRKYAFHLTRGGARCLREAAAHVHRARVGGPGMRPVPVPWLHMTLTGLGDVREVPDEALARIHERVFAHWSRHPRPVLVYDQLLLARESVMLTARDDAWLQGLVDLQRRAVDQELGSRPWRAFQPHTSLAYATAAVGRPALEQRLGPVADDLPPELEVTPRLTLMRLCRDTGAYEWEVVHEE